MRGEFYKMDYEAWDEGTIDLSLEQEAAYLRLCHQMYRRYGPVPNSPRLLQVIWRCHHTKAHAILKALIATGKVYVTEDNRLANRRVMRELEERGQVSDMRREAGRKGGSRPRQDPEKTPTKGGEDPEKTSTRPGEDPEKTSRTDLTPEEKLNDFNGDAEASAKHIREEKRREEERREEKKEEKQSAGEPATLFPSEFEWPDNAFDLFWKAYPSKVGKGAAEAKFHIVRKSRKVKWDDFWAGLQAYIHKRDDRPWCNPATWIFQRRWEDAPAPARSASAASRYYSP